MDITLLHLNKLFKGWVAEHKFHPKRKWRFDYANPEYMIATEIEGGLWVYGRHNRAKSMIKDMEKYNTATLMGWKVLRYTPQQMAEMMNDVENLYKKIKEGRI